ncbi:hypothetical protein CPB84DRAFT_1963000 [Gymnopilus junonius]|uniref:Uncharacterized protein n=1 Tax=Gymnopilus junonius TaxID=109634 RepID=A0A9P5NNT4_GYMJU|nr:hypothetical protein CPB84DRAFT_1963000 [Gymnopilus junonius]
MSYSELHYRYPGCSGWSYPISDARSEPIPPQRPSQQPTPQLSPRPPPQSFPPLPTKIGRGLWILDDDILLGCGWPPVQHYLAQVRKERRIVDPPTRLIWALAALDVLSDRKDVAHWLFWSPEVYERHAKEVDIVALHKPRLIKSRVLWTGRVEYQSTLSQNQEKYVYVTVNGINYPTEPKLDKKRNTRSSGEPTLKTGKQYHHLEVGCYCLVCTGSKKDNSQKKRKVAKPAHKKALKSPRAPRKAPCPTSVPDKVAIDTETTTLDRSLVTLLPNSRAKSQSPHLTAMSPTCSPRKKDVELSPPLPSSLSSASSSHSRSTSQSSAETLIGNSRCSSVESSVTVVGASPSKKRKAVEMEKDDDNLTDGSKLTDRMVTRGRASKHCAVNPEESRLLLQLLCLSSKLNPHQQDRNLEQGELGHNSRYKLFFFIF